MVELRRRALIQIGLIGSLSACLPLRAPVTAKSQVVRVSAPFDMPDIRIPDFAGSPIFQITDFGADASDQAKTSAAIAQAIAAAHNAGSGIVFVPPGVWPTAKIHLASNVNLHLSKGATLLFSERPSDYLPPVHTTWEGLECYNYSPLIYAYESHNVAVTGEGTLKAKMDVWRTWVGRPQGFMEGLVKLYNMAVQGIPVQQRQMTDGTTNLRPQFIQFNRCRNVLVEDVSIENSPFWTIHPYLCQDVVVRRVKVQALGGNNDGVDPEMSQNVLIEDCVFDQGDDAVSVKSGREFDGWRLGTPSKNIVVRNCRVKNGNEMMAIGSELSGGVENVLVDNCHFNHGDSPARRKMTNILFIKTNERRGGYVRNIHLSNVTGTTVAGSALCIETDVLYQWRHITPTYERRLTPIQGVHVSNVVLEKANHLCRVLGTPELPVDGVTLRNVTARAVGPNPIVTRNVTNFSADAS